MIINSNLDCNHFLSLLRRIIQSDGRESDFKQVFQTLFRQNAFREAASILETLHAEESRFALGVSAERYSYVNLMHYSSQTFSNFSKYFFCSLKVNGASLYKGLYDHMLTADAVRIIMADLALRGKLRPIPWYVCQATKEEPEGHFRRTLDTVLSQWQQTSDPAPKRAIFIVQHGKSAHLTPVLIEKISRSIYKILITDSVGGRKLENFVSPILNVLSEKFSSGTLSSAFVYSGDYRQADAMHCAICAIRDAVKMSKKADTIFDWVHTYGESQIAYKIRHLRVIHFKYLPPSMMKLTQNPSVEEYSKTLNDAGLSAYLETRKRKIGCRYLEETIVEMETNTKVQETYLKYERTILRSLALLEGFKPADSTSIH